MRKFTHLEPNGLKDAKDLLENGKFKQTLQILNVFNEKNNLSPEEQVQYFLIKSSLSNRLGNMEEGLEYAEKAYQAGELLTNLQLADILFERAIVFISQMKENELRDIIVKSELSCIKI